jgi:hypothetical protein
VAVGLVHTVVSISACGAEHPGSIPGLDSMNAISYSSLFAFLACKFSYASNDHLSEMAKNQLDWGTYFLSKIS